MTIITKDEWKRRYARVLVAEGGMSQEAADQASEIAVAQADGWLTPEDAARDEVSHWEPAQ